MGYFSAKNSAYSMVPTCNWHIFFCHFYYYLILLLYCLLLLYLSYSCRTWQMQQGYLKITMKCHLKQNDHSFIIIIPIFTYGEFSYYTYITFIIVINTMCHGEMQTKMLPAFLRKNYLQQLTNHPPPPSQYIIDSITITSIRSLYQYNT